MISSLQLAAWRVGALDPARAAEVERALRARPELLVATTWTAPPADPWLLPPPSRRPLGLTVERAEVFGGPPRPGDRFLVRVPEADPALQVVLLYRAPGRAWELVFPGIGDTPLVVGELGPKAGPRMLEIELGPERGRQRWAVLLAPPGEPVSPALLGRPGVAVEVFDVEVGASGRSRE